MLDNKAADGSAILNQGHPCTAITLRLQESPSHFHPRLFKKYMFTHI